MAFSTDASAYGGDSWTKTWGVDWAQPGDPSLYGVLKECQASGQEVEIVTGSTPGWTNPWSRSACVQIVSFDFMLVTVQSNKTWTIPRDEIQAIRVVAQREACQTRH